LDSDLAESLQALKASFEQRVLPAQFGKADKAHVEALRARLRLPRRYREFLMAADPIDVETRTPAERVRFVPSSRLLEEQQGFALTETGEARPPGPGPAGWRPGWIIVAHSALLGDPYFLDVSSPDAEGDCPVLTAMSGTDNWKPRFCASTFATFLQILAIGMEVAKNFPDGGDVEDEQVFRESLGPRIRTYDPAALKAGHWT